MRHHILAVCIHTVKSIKRKTFFHSTRYIHKVIAGSCPRSPFADSASSYRASARCLTLWCISAGSRFCGALIRSWRSMPQWLPGCLCCISRHRSFLDICAADAFAGFCCSGRSRALRLPIICLFFPSANSTSSAFKETPYTFFSLFICVVIILHSSAYHHTHTTVPILFHKLCFFIECHTVKKSASGSPFSLVSGPPPQ